MSKAIESMPESVIQKNHLLNAGYAQCVFIFLQALIFPDAGVLGGVIAAQCALMPWLIPILKKAPVVALSMVVSSALLSPLYSWLCLSLLSFLTP
jgi:hypothetical protein